MEFAARSPSVIAAYDPRWPALFLDAAARMRDELGAVACRIDHIGSTAVPGLAAKPVIDIQISVASLEPLEAYRNPLERLGYVYRAANTDRSKRYFRETPETQRMHVHVRRQGSWGEQFALLFRDYLRMHPEAAARYADVKQDLARQFAPQGDWDAYTEAKGPCIWAIVMEATSWSQATGWEPGPPDG